MNKTHKVYFNWSSGKDASLALYYLQQGENYHVDQLLTSINAFHNRVSMHGLRRELLVKQAAEIGLPLRTIELPEQPSMEVYNKAMETAVAQLQAEGYSHCGFGDIFLEDLRQYREAQLKPYGIQCQFPLWKRDTQALIDEFLDLGFKAVVVCINGQLLAESFVGRELNKSFVQDLPANVDPCGENGEFHTFCYDGPIFSNPVKFSIGEKVYREYKQPKENDETINPNPMGFWFCDLLLDE